MGKLAFDGAKRGMLYQLDADQIVLITDKNHPLYDPRIELPLEESLVLNIMLNGVIEPIVVRSVNGRPEVVDGRQRVRATLEANKRLKKAGKTLVRIPAIPRKGTDADLFGVSVSANENRQDDTPMGRAEKANRLLNLGQTEEEVAVAFGVGVQTVKNWTKLVELSAPVRKAVEAGKLSATAAIKLADVPAEEQKAILADLPTGTTKTGKPKKPTVKQTRQAASKATGRDKNIGMKTAKDIRALIKGTKNMHSKFLEALCWVLNEDPDDYREQK